MNPEKQLESSMWITIFLQTIGSVDLPGTGARKMPSPHAYVSIIVVWTILGFFSGSWQRAAAGLGWLMVLVSMVLGPFGNRAVGFLNFVGKNFGINTQTFIANTGKGLGNIGNTVTGKVRPPASPPSSPQTVRPRSVTPSNVQV